MTTFAVPKIDSFRLISERQEVFPPDGYNLKIINMYAIVEIAGQQFKVEKDKKVFVHRLAAAEGSSVDFDKVLLIENEGNVSVGTPVVEGAKVTVKVLEHTKGDKVLIFKKKRRKSYQKMNGHRQSFTQVLIEEIVG
jgi:large subunit ribosomal protein L21